MPGHNSWSKRRSFIKRSKRGIGDTIMPTSTNIPLAREKLKEAEKILEVGGSGQTATAIQLIKDALSLMTRKQTHPNSRKISSKVTSERVIKVLKILKKHPFLTEVEIGRKVNLGPGRINEIKNGYRTPEHPEINRTLLVKNRHPDMFIALSKSKQLELV